MSEFSFSFHLRTNNSQEVVNLLKGCGLNGYVFPSTNNWTTFVCEEEDIEKNDKLINANSGLLVYYTFAEEYGWGFSIFKDNKKICSYDCLWGGPIFDEDGEVIIDENGELLELEDITIDDSNLNVNELLGLIENDFSKVNKMKEILYPKSMQETIESNPHCAFTELLGIENTNWISYGIVSRHTNNFEGVVQVDKL
ncbi:MAG TPA: hypothetical protein VIR55_05435 [Ignavibacteria bacterium]